MKLQEKYEARSMRQKGKSLKDIAVALSVAKSSVSMWVRDISLTEEQISSIKDKQSTSHRIGTTASREKYLSIRQNWQLEGRKMARSYYNDWLFVSGTMLYWAEGSKSRNAVVMSNSDSHMLVLFLEYLCAYFQIDQTKLRMSVDCYVTDDVTIDDIHQYWSKTLGIPITNARKPRVKHTKTELHQKHYASTKYGICKLYYGNTEVVQKIYGAIQEIGRFEQPTWAQ